VGASDDVGGHQAITDALAGISAGTDGGIHSAGFTTNQHRDVTATNEFATDEAHFGRFGHGVSRFDGGHQAPCLNHAEGDAHGFTCHYLLLEEGGGMFGVTLLLRHPFRQPIRPGKSITVSRWRHKGLLCGGHKTLEFMQRQALR
jgi:hypothetical protein